MGLPHHEYWPWWTLLAPFWPRWIWYGIRSRCLTWFTVVNPGIEDGGFMGESKMAILDIIPEEFKPKTIFIPVKGPSKSFDKFPFIAKPDIGGRGRKVQVIENPKQLADYHQSMDEDYMLQEIIPGPLELGVYYTRHPEEEKGQIISLASKAFLEVIGDGQSSIKELMAQDDRAAKQIERLSSKLDLEVILPSGESKILEPIGNHVRGTAFINEEARINDELNATFDKICAKIHGFYYGRFDIRVPSWEDLYAGRNISILELNGLTSDPAHIFDPNYRLRDVFKTQRKHIKIAYGIARYHLKNGVKATPILELMRKSMPSIREL